MSKKVFIRDITGDQQEVNDLFVVGKKATYTAKNNSRYMAVSLKDSTGSIEGRVWDRVDEFEGLFDKGDIVSVRSVTNLYQNKLQLKIRDIRRVDTDIPAGEMARFYPAGDRSAGALEDEYARTVEEVKDPHLKGLLNAFSGDRPLLERFFSYPASVGVHHVYIGGLLEHSLSVAKMGMAASSLIGGDRDIIITGSILHDVGKIDELEISRGFRFTDRGRLLGHITLGVMILEGLVRRVDGFPDALTDILTHIIVSHHGLEEWGSPKKPMFAEALMVHYLDNLDSKVMGVREHMKDNMADERWSEYHRLYEAKFFKIS